MVKHGDKKGTCNLIDVAASGERSLIRKKLRIFYNTKLVQYKYSECGM
jgi:hypothetical protein